MFKLGPYFAGVATVVAAVGVGFGGSVLLLDSKVSSATPSLMARNMPPPKVANATPETNVVPQIISPIPVVLPLPSPQEVQQALENAAKIPGTAPAPSGTPPTQTLVASAKQDESRLAQAAEDKPIPRKRVAVREQRRGIADRRGERTYIVRRELDDRDVMVRVSGRRATFYDNEPELGRGAPSLFGF